MTRVSVVMPVFNAHAWLHEAVESVLAQDHPDLELVVVDDGSTDPRTVSLLEDPPWPGVTVIRQENAGQAAARNAGIAAATGEYILPLDADDRIAPTYVSQAAAVLDADRAIGIVYCRAEFMGAKSGVWELPPYSLKGLLTEGIIFVTSMFRKQDWSAVGGFDDALRLREDHDFWLKIVGLGREVHRLDDVLFTYRVREGSVNSTFTREEFAASYSRIMRNNAALYIDNADLLVTAWLERTDRLADYHHRYRVLENLITNHPMAYGLLRRTKRFLRRNPG